MVKRALIPEEKILDGEAVTVRCVHGDTVLYPLAEVVLQVDGVDVKTIAAVSNTLPVSVLLGTDVPELNCLLQSNPSSMHTRGVEEALVVMTWAQSKREKMEEKAQAEKEEISGTRPSPIEEVGEQTEENEQAEVEEETDIEETEELFGSSFSEELFQKEKGQRQQLIRKQKRQERHRYSLVRAKDKPESSGKVDGSLHITAELQHLQEIDETLDTVWKAVEGKTVDVPVTSKRMAYCTGTWCPKDRKK